MVRRSAAGRNLRIDWAEQPLRRKHPATAMGLGAPQRDVTAQGNLPTVELFDADGCLTAAALSVCLFAFIGFYSLIRPWVQRLVREMKQDARAICS